MNLDNYQRPEKILSYNEALIITKKEYEILKNIAKKEKKRIEKEIGPVKVVLTGGFADVIKNILELEYVYEPNLLIEGLIILYNKNK